MNTITCISANFIARELGYHMTGGWGQGHQAMREYFAPEETFAERFDALCAEIQDLGFSAIDLYVGHLEPQTARPRQIEETRQILERRGLSLVGMSATLVQDPATIRAFCEGLRSLGGDIWHGNSGLLKSDRAAFVDILRETGVRFGFENHPDEKTPVDVLEMIGEDDADVIGVAVDTGWFATNRFPPSEAISVLLPRLFHVHLKDILEPDGSQPGKTLKSVGHETCALGEGVADVPACVSVLRQGGYLGPIAIEHEPEEYDPTDDLRLSLGRLRDWLQA